MKKYQSLLDSKNIKEWDDVIISNKSDLAKLKIPKRFAEMRITSGSSGEPLLIFYSKEAVDAFIKRTVISLKMSEVNKNDIVLNLFSYGNYIPGSMYERACLNLDIPVLPLGSPSTYPKEGIIKIIKKIKPTVWFSVPSYALNILNEIHLSNPEAKPKKIIVAGERLLSSYINRFKEMGVEVINHFGLTECPAIGVSKKGNPEIIEVISEGILAEELSISDKTELIITDLNNTSTQIIKYRTQDCIENIKKDNEGFISEFKIGARNDSLIKLQGVFISKTKILDLISKYTSDFIINIKTKNNRDFLEITLPENYKGQLKDILLDLSFISVKKEFIFVKNIVIPKTLSNKLKQIHDIRK